MHLFLFLLLSFEHHTLSVLLSHLLLCAGTAQCYLFLWEFQTQLSSPFSRLMSTYPTMCQIACQSAQLCWVFVIFYRKLDVIFQSHKRWCQKWWACAYLLSRLSFFSSPPSSSSFLFFITVTIVAAVPIITINIVIETIIAFIMFCYLWFPAVAPF